MLQRLRGRDPLLWGQRQAALEQVNEVVEIPRLGITHALRRGQQAGTQVTRGLDGREGWYAGLQAGQ